MKYLITLALVMRSISKDDAAWIRDWLCIVFCIVSYGLVIIVRVGL